MRIGIDLGGTKTEIIALDSEGIIRFRKRVKTIRNKYTATIHTIVSLVNEAETALDVKASVGIGIPGAVSSKTGRIKNANSVWLIDTPLKQDLEKELQREIRMANDANCFTVSEAIDGAARQGKMVFGVIVGTGTGGGIALNGKPHAGLNAIAGEWGHNPLPWATAEDTLNPCYCGKNGCIETFLSGPGLVLHYQQRGGAAASVEDIVEQAERGNRLAEDILDYHAKCMARSLASVINILDPDVIVLGGGLSNLESIYTRVPEYWSRFVFSDEVTTPLVKAQHGDSSGVRGAAWLWGLNDENST